MDANQVAAYRKLKDANVQVSKNNAIEFNSGSETHRHLQAKATVAYVGSQQGYRVSSEVELPSGEVDILLWGHPDRLTWAVEVETSPTEEVKSDKLHRYVTTVNPVDDMLLLNLNEMPDNRLEVLEWVRSKL